jgi:hypothetical protein
MDKVKEYRKQWQQKHKLRMRMHKLKWYYKNREIINMMFSKPTSIVPDAADLYYAERNPNG